MKRPDSHVSLKVLTFDPTFNLQIFTAVFHQTDDTYKDGSSLLCPPFSLCIWNIDVCTDNGDGFERQDENYTILKELQS